MSGTSQTHIGVLSLNSRVRIKPSSRNHNSTNMDETLHPMLGDSEMGVIHPANGQKKNQYLAAVCVSMGAVCAGSALAWTSPVLPQLSMPISNLNTSNMINTTNAMLLADNTTLSNTKITQATSFYLSESEGSLVGSILAMGALCAALPAGYVADKIGRRKANLLISIPFLLNWIIIVFANGPLMLYIARLLAGIATGAVCVTAPMYIGEIGEVTIRGTLGSFFQMCICLGILLTSVFGALTTWVGLSWILMTVPVIFFVCMYFMPDTPVYLAKCGYTSSAESSLRFFRGQMYNINQELKTIQGDLVKAEEKTAGIKDLISNRGNRKALLSSLGLMLFQQLSGINAVIFYTVPIFQSAGTSFSPDAAAIIVAIVQFIISYIAAMIIDKANRRFYLIISSLGMMVCLGALGMYFHLQMNNITFTGIGMIPLVSLVLFIVTFSLGFGPVPWMIMGELFGPEIKGLASGIAVTENWFLVFLVTFSFPLMNSSLGGHVTFYLFAVIMSIGTVFVYYYVPETRGKTLQEIQETLNE